ncbi:MAG: tetratricopeptide repeat protein [Rhodospirillales bacterium]
MKTTQSPDAPKRKTGLAAGRGFSRFVFPLMAVMAMLGGPAAAQHPPDQHNQEKYSLCMALSKSNPDAAFDMALAWQDFGGGEPAGHCVAAALVGLEIYDEAARRFEALAQASRAEPAIRAGIFAHAAQAWLLDGNLKRAESILDGALKLQPADPGLLTDRAVVRAERKNFPKAIEDLDAAIKLDPERAEAYVYRASARRQLEQLEAAEADSNRALRLDPGHLGGLLERGILRRLRGDAAGARADWLKILELASDSAAAQSARGNLEQMDVKKP